MNCKNAKKRDEDHLKKKVDESGLCLDCRREVARGAREKAAEQAAKLRTKCIDCRAAGRPLDRPAPHPGPRCASDWREAKKATRKRVAATRIERVYSLTPAAYTAILTAQGGTCAWPGCRANGRTRPLNVDHDHACCDGPTSCGKCVRGLLCANHNTLLGPPGVPQSVVTIGDDPQVWLGIVQYLRRPPAQAALLAMDTEVFVVEQDLVEAS